MHVHALLAGMARQGGGGAQHIQLQQTQFAVADDKKVAAAAGGVEKAQRAQLFVKLKQLIALAFDFFKLGAQFIQKKRANELEDVFFRCVVRAQVAAGLFVHDGLKQAAEDGGADG